MAGKGVGDAVGPIKTGINVGQKISETLFPQTKQVFKDYWSGDIAKGVVNSEDGIFTSNFWTGDTTVFRSGGKKFYFKEGNPIMIVKQNGKQIGYAHVKDFFSNGLGTNKIYKSVAEIKKKYGSGVDIHKQILKVTPYRGLTVPGQNYTGPGNPLHDQLRHDDEGNILEIYQQPTGPTDAVSMQHDVDYTVCGNKPKSEQLKCKHAADKKMVNSLDAIPWKKRQWGHWLARTIINTKQKLGLGLNARRR